MFISVVADQEVVKNSLVCLEIAHPNDGWLVDAHKHGKTIPG